MTILIEKEFLELASTFRFDYRELFWCVPEYDPNGIELGWTLGFSVGEGCNVNSGQEYNQIVLGDENGKLTRFDSINDVKDFVLRSGINITRVQVDY